MHSTCRIARCAIMAGITLATVCALHPVHNRMLQSGLFAGIALVWIGCLHFSWNRKRIRLCLLAVPALALTPFALPGKAIDPDRLRTDCTKRMLGFEGAAYLWGGESPRGIDCSGLPRRALRDALWAEGWQRANGAAFRSWLDLWCFDSSAKAMGRAYRGRTKALDLSGALWDLDPARLLPGDLAIRSDGVHVVVYLGKGRWIEADPRSGKVRSWIPTPADGPWYEPMALHRWVALDAAGR